MRLKHPIESNTKDQDSFRYNASKEVVDISQYDDLYFSKA